MNLASLTASAEEHLNRLCVDISTRAVGSQGNQDATAYAAVLLRSWGWEVQTPRFHCMDWDEWGADLTAGETHFEVLASPYTLPVDVAASLAVLSTVEELEAAELGGKVALLRGPLAREQLAPKNFPWWNPEEHQRIIALLEGGAPAAIVAATSRNPETAGAVYPFPLIEDGDFDIPSAFMTEEEGVRLAAHDGQAVHLAIRAARRESEGCNVVAQRGQPDDQARYVMSAHIDAKRGTPGAVDDGTGVIVLLLLGELLAEFEPEWVIELVMFNGEDYYAAPGERLYLEQHPELTKLELLINIDGAGYYRGDSHFSLYNLTDEAAARVRGALTAHGLAEGPQWFQGDHSIFVMAGRPAVAITSDIGEVSEQVTHTPKDNAGIVDCAKVAQIAMALEALLRGVD